METDFSKLLYKKYFSCSNRLIELTLKNGRKINGVFISFFLGNQDGNDPYIRKWCIVDEKYKMTFGIDAFGFRIGEIINQNDIMSIKFLDDNSQMKFD
ncbi:MAG: hypothetical protein AB7O73_12750 [Bacteroidia bacterium]